MTIASDTKSGTLYMTTNSCGSIAVAKSKKDLNLWHQRLGHMSSKGLEIIHLNGKLSGLKSTDMDMCEICILGK